MATPVAPFRVPNVGAIGKRRFGLESHDGESGGSSAAQEGRDGAVRGRLATFPLLDLYEFISSGPLLKKIGFTPEMVGQRIDEWLALGVRLSRQLQFDEFALSHSEKVRIYHYYVPVFLWCKRELETHTSKFKLGEPVPALVIGISAPQGCGKTPIVYSLEYLLAVELPLFPLTISTLQQPNRGNSEQATPDIDFWRCGVTRGVMI